MNKLFLIFILLFAGQNIQVEKVKRQSNQSFSTENILVHCGCPDGFYLNIINVDGATSYGASPMKTVSTAWGSHTTRGPACACIPENRKAQVTISNIEATVSNKTVRVYSNGVLSTKVIGPNVESVCYGTAPWQTNVVLWPGCP